VTATLLAQQWLVDLIASRAEAMPRQAVVTLLNLGATPIHGAPLSRMFAITNVPEIAAVLDRRSALKLGRPQFLFDIPVRTVIGGRTAKGAL
jgi:hypothetical protein